MPPLLIIMKLNPDTPIGKEQFLIEHNKLSPENLCTTFALLTRFQEEKRPLLKDADWSFKLRMPLILWLLSLPPEKKRKIRKSEKTEYKIYPYSEF